MSNKDKKNATSFQLGDKAAEKWTYDEVEKIMHQMRENAKNNNDVLCLQDAIASVDLYTSSLNYLLDKFPNFENIKKDIQDLIIRRINKNALEGDYTPAASIWRMKQLGERDTQYQETKNEHHVSTKNIDELWTFDDE